MRRPLLAGVVAVGVVLVGVTASSSPAFAHRRRHRRPPPATSGSLFIDDQAALSADHKTADVVLTVTCPVGASPTHIRVSVRQSGTSGSATSGTDYVCDGYPKQVVVPVRAGSGTFQKGSAMASASGAWHSSAPDSNDTTTDSDSQPIQLV